MLGGNNASLFDVAKFLIAHADQENADKPVIAVTAYMYTTAGKYPGGPWLIFSEAALPLREVIAQIAEDVFIDADRKKNPVVPPGQVALAKGSLIAPGIRDNIAKHARCSGLSNALQLPKHGAMFLKYTLTLIERAITKLNIAKDLIKIISVGAGLFKVGMTPKTVDHKMSVTKGLLSASERKVKNLSGEDISQGLHGRSSGSRDGDPYWEARGDDGPPALVVSGALKDQLTTYKKVQALSAQAARMRIDKKIAGAEAGSLTEAMVDLNFRGFKNLPISTQLFKAGKRQRNGDANGRAILAIKGGNTTGEGAWDASARAGFLWNGRPTQDKIDKFDDLSAQYPELFVTADPQQRMPHWNSKIWKKWDPSMPHYLATVIDVEVLRTVRPPNSARTPIAPLHLLPLPAPPSPRADHSTYNARSFTGNRRRAARLHHPIRYERQRYAPRRRWREVPHAGCAPRPRHERVVLQQPELRYDRQAETSAEKLLQRVGCAPLQPELPNPWDM